MFLHFITHWETDNLHLHFGPNYWFIYSLNLSIFVSLFISWGNEVQMCCPKLFRLWVPYFVVLTKFSLIISLTAQWFVIDGLKVCILLLCCDICLANVLVVPIVVQPTSNWWIYMTKLFASIKKLFI